MNNEIKELFRRYESGEASSQERELVETWFAKYDKIPVQLDDRDKQALNELSAHLEEYSQKPPVIPMTRRPGNFKRFAAAAAILIFSVIGAYLYLGQAEKPGTLVRSSKKDILPGGNKATLTLSNGRQIILNDAKNGNLARQGLTAVQKTGDGLLAYQAGKTDGGGDNLTAHSDDHNMITTPRGGQYRVILPDGTVAWLNSVSSIRFPVAFPGKERKVVTTGEVYFEVAKDRNKPFIVSSAGQTVTVLGTHFNVMAYPEEGSIVTTLLEGSVSIAKGGQSRILKPGEQALAAEHIRVTATDTDDAIAWKNGIMSFTDADIKTIMRKISRWYDIDIEYQGHITDRVFTGAISRKSSLSGILKILTLNGIQFSVQGNKLMIKQ
ncbi:FecR family protein [Pedobacter hartonius]|uniref:FecR family protein n=1 Tax=Pedobacter hartonius TaxID=425514 RepID=A0A1H4G3D5_9SPHI|nr:FecR family protein [Pedobacter hartonius]SEB04095.1 FecR family protein [Pedobacter hartonius]